MPPLLLTNFEVQRYHQNEPKLNGVYSRNNLPKLKDSAYVINLDEYETIRTHWIALSVNGNNRRTSHDTIHFERFGDEHIQKEINKIIGNKNIVTNIYKIQAYDSKMWEYFCIRFNDLMLKGKSLLDHTNLFSPNYYGKDHKIIPKYFK